MSQPIGIIVLGANGRMGRTICQLAKNEPQFRLAGAVDVKNVLSELATMGSPVCDNVAEILAKDNDAVIIDFTTPKATLDAAAAAEKFNTPIVIGTTGFTQAQKDVLAGFAAETPILMSANMSIGVNVLLAILPELAKALGPAYDIEMAEIHHRNKKDAPSGTALMLAEGLANSRNLNLDKVRNSCRNGLIDQRPDNEIGVQALRGGDVVGIHTTYFLGPGEIIEVKHQAESRENFAQGALRAASWLKNKAAGRIYTMKDVIGI